MAELENSNKTEQVKTVQEKTEQTRTTQEQTKTTQGYRPNQGNSRPQGNRPNQGGRPNQNRGGYQPKYQQRRPNNYQGNYQKRNNMFPTRRKVCPIRIEEINWKKVDSLRYFIGEGGGIRPRRKTGATAKLQRKAAIAIKRARHMALLPFTAEHLRLMRNQRD
jgi:small subunit ribosomal protein S18